MRRVTRALDLALGVPGGIGDFLCCENCGSMVSPGHWDDDGPCPVCGAFPVGENTTPIPPDRLIDRIVAICQDVLRGDTTPTGRDLAAVILDEVPHVEV